uniref:Uncharacterized protein n=1 Tax=Guillardia theta TaxID=55529 RepID=A0A7S4PIY6_GUITH|mmetsp:Transcript_52168/g.162089  ORF Transcript_52168/g.162089 Transcript_52168/m.162089 type:complete len:359 (+) Transcript_52168:127-1203(+)
MASYSAIAAKIMKSFRSVFLVCSILLFFCLGHSSSDDSNSSKLQDRQGKEAYATLITTKEYIQGAIVLSRIVKSTDEERPFIALVLDELLLNLGGSAIRRTLEDNGIEVVPVPRVKRPTGAGALSYPNYATTYSKLFVWNLTAYRLVLYLDADLLPLSSLAPLFDRDVDVVAAVPDISLPDHFNSALVLLRPNLLHLQRLLALSSSLEPYDGGDQGLLNEFFNNNSAWYESHSSNRLGLELNLPVVLSRLHPRSWLRTLPRAKVIHFSGGPDRRPWGIAGAVDPSVAAAALVWHAVLCKRCFDVNGTRRSGRAGGRGSCLRADQVRKLIALPVNNAMAVRSMGPAAFKAKVKEILQDE